MSGERAFKGLSRGFSEVVGAQASRTVLKIRCKSSSVYLGTGGAAAGITATGKFTPGGPAGWLNNSSPDSGGGKESGRATEGRSLRRQLRPRTEVILKLIFSKNTLPNGLADPLGMEKLEL